MAELASDAPESEELIRLCRERDLLDLQIAAVAAQFAETGRSFAGMTAGC